MEWTGLVIEMVQYDEHRYCLRDHCRPCSSCYAHIQHENEDRVKDRVEDDREYGQSHSLFRISG